MSILKKAYDPWDKLLENPHVTSKKRYTEHELRKLLPGYSKGKYKMTGLMEKVKVAAQNEM